MNSFKNFPEKTRSELSESRFENLEFQNAINKLVEINFLLPFTERENFQLYHGTSREDLKIDEFHKSWLSAMAFHWFYATENYDTALNDYASWKVEKVHKIVPRNGGGYIVNETKKFSNEEKTIIRDALKNIIPSIGELVDENFISKENAKDHIVEQNSLRNKYLQKGISAFSGLMKMDEFQQNQPEEFRILSAVNTYNYLYHFPNRLLTNLWRNNVRTSDGSFVPISQEFLRVIIEKMHLIGIKTTIDSATSGGLIEPVVFFDFGKIQTEKAENMEKENRKNIFSELAKKFWNQLEDYWNPTSPQANSLKNSLTKSYISPEKMVISAKNIHPKFAKIFEEETGVWEGYTLEQHTETVLDNFEKNFADKIPVGLLAFMRLMILVHDMGKDKKAEKKYDLDVIKDFLSEIGVSGKLQQNIEFFITNGAEFAGKYFVFKEKNDSFVKKNLAELQNHSQGEAILNLLYAFVVSDGGAYTNMGITRHRIKGLWILKHKNAKSFDDSFEKPINNLNNYLKLKK